MATKRLSRSFVLLGIGSGLLISALVGPRGMAAEPAASGLPEETKAQRDQRMAWWREARFGMFIHWGLYAVPAG